jgi:hypothetical protein
MCLSMVSPSAPTNNQDIDLEARNNVSPTPGNGIQTERGCGMYTIYDGRKVSIDLMQTYGQQLTLHAAHA